jgi:DNA-binding NtrC family response regulator
MIGFLTKDLIFQSRVSGAAKLAGQQLVCAFNLEALKAKIPADSTMPLVIVDLTLPGLDIAAIGTQLREAFPNSQLVAYAPHVAEDAIETARTTKFDMVLTRGQFDRMFTQLIANASSAD